MAAGGSQDARKVAPQRLLSLRGERDLTLGALNLKNKKKNFCPVMPSQAKTKVKAEIVSEFAPPPEVKLKPNVLQRSNDRSKPNTAPRGRAQDVAENKADELQFVQMKSAFEQGPMMMQSHVNNSRPHLGGGRSSEKFAKEDSKSAAGTAALNKLEETMNLEADTKDILDRLLRDDFISDSFSAATDESDMAPVSLPLRCCKQLATKSKGAKPMRRIKEESVDDSGEPWPHDKTDTTRTTFVTHSLTDDALRPSDVFAANSAMQNELLLFQLPDVLPGVPFSKAGSSSSLKVTSNDSQKFSLSDFEESQIGRLVVRRSGRTQLVLGNVTFDVSTGSANSCLQDLVSVRVEDGTTSSSGGSLAVLGHVQHKLLCVPDVDQLLDSTPSAS